LKRKRKRIGSLSYFTEDWLVHMQTRGCFMMVIYFIYLIKNSFRREKEIQFHFFFFYCLFVAFLWLILGVSIFSILQVQFFIGDVAWWIAKKSWACKNSRAGYTKMMKERTVFKLSFGGPKVQNLDGFFFPSIKVFLKISCL